MDILADKKCAMIKHQLRSRGIASDVVIAAMSRISRESFVDPEDIEKAYDDGPVNIGQGQTVSQPYMVAMMTEALRLKKTDKVLEVGTGSGYQAAVLREISARVYTIERISCLAEKAGARLAALGYGDIKIQVGDGTLGWPDEAPFDAVIVTSGSPEVPAPLLDQLNEGGRIIIPVGTRNHQKILKITRSQDNFIREEMISCVFVPLIGAHGWSEDEV